jgi:hypothetical protein
VIAKSPISRPSAMVSNALSVSEGLIARDTCRRTSPELCVGRTWRGAARRGEVHNDSTSIIPWRV